MSSQYPNVRIERIIDLGYSEDDIASKVQAAFNLIFSAINLSVQHVLH